MNAQTHPASPSSSVADFNRARVKLEMKELSGSRVRRFLGAAWLLVLGASAQQAATPDFIFATAGEVAPILVEASAGTAVARAASDLGTDVERVAGLLPSQINAAPSAKTRRVVIAGIVGQSALLDGLIAARKLDAQSLAKTWESFIIAVVPNPVPGIEQALVIAGSDRRGAIFGIYEVSQMIGVSPWHWWSDVVPARQSTLKIPAGTHRFGPPSVKYRGIFINDEDWGLQPWAAKTFEPESGNIGPKTYAKVFELLLRLKANTVWPGMHPTTKAFNLDPRNKEVADAYGIVMGSSHAEPMLRNNVGEWTAPPTEYNYISNREQVLGYWEQRVKENGRYDNIYTLGMRGIHDSRMQGPTTDPERIQTLEKIFAAQRELIARHVNPAVETVPQMFCAYKEVLDLYRQGLRVPDDVTIVWPDDNFGYIRNVANATERKRSGGFGVYYHLSYLGAPLSYLWLCTTPPALVWEEMHKAYEHGADRIWIANIGDLKPAEIPLQFFLEMAWDIKRWQPSNLGNYLHDFAQRNFGPAHAREIASLLTSYYELNFQRKPEHLQWWLPRQPRQPSPLSDPEIASRLATFTALRARAEALATQLPAALRPAYFQLVQYPVAGSALANLRYFEAERGNTAAARDADQVLTALTRYYNEELSGGKWRGLMTLEPADPQWAGLRLETWKPPAEARAPKPGPIADSFLARKGGDFTATVARRGGAWTIIPGLGRTGGAVAVLPTTIDSVSTEDAAKSAPYVDYAMTFPRAGDFTVQIHLVPTHPLSGNRLTLALGLNDGPVQTVSISVDDGGPGWRSGELDAVRVASTTIHVAQAGPQTLRMYGTEPGIAVDKIVVDLGGLTPTYLGPPTSR